MSTRWCSGPDLPGLAATLRSTYEGRRVALLELGKSVTNRGRHVPADLVTGVGGAGLFSDGKFSFFPSASNLWRLAHREDVRAAYGWLSEILSEFTAVPPYPSEEEVATGIQVLRGRWEGLRKPVHRLRRSR